MDPIRTVVAWGIGLMLVLLGVELAFAAEPPSQTLAGLVHWYHGVIVLGGVLGVFATVHRIWIAPIQAWRRGQETRMVALETQQALTDQRLGQGTEKMQRMEQKLDCLDRKFDTHHQEVLTRLTAMETLMRHGGGLPPEA